MFECSVMITSERGREAEEEDFILTVSRRRTILEENKWSKAKGKGGEDEEAKRKSLLCVSLCLCVRARLCKQRVRALKIFQRRIAS